ncbi:ATP-dependent helicase [Candidatus Parcubacteria bacterium]|nr:ATP-dependent helicase [Candidatus Parcubacteria bacterium]
MAGDTFERLYKGLNVGQKNAVDTVEGPVMVVAGPGTGKTTVLTLRIANILRTTDTPPDGILALTFTESAVASMRRKLVGLIGPRAYRVGLFTFHGFAEEVIKKYPEYFPRIIGGDIATEAEKLSIIEEIIEKNDFEYIKPFRAPFFYVQSILHTISDLKRDAVSPREFLKVLEKEEKDILSHEDVYHTKGKYKGEMKTLYKNTLRSTEKNRELTKVYTEYEKALEVRSLYDFDDQLLELLRALKEEKDLLQTLQEEFLYFLADEHQDANNAQNQILELLSSYFTEPNLFIVGDEKQAIYRFQGASLENFLYFRTKFPTAKFIYLDESYRSTQNILDVSYSLAALLPGDPKLRPELKSRTEKKGLISVIDYRTEKDEYEGLVENILKRIENGEDPDDMAVLVRTNREIADVGRALLAKNISTNLYQDEDVLSDREIFKFMLLLRAISDPQNETIVGETLFIDFLKVDSIQVIQILDKAKKERVHVLEALKNINSEFSNLFSKWIKAARNQSALDAFTTILAESLFTEHLLTLPESIQKMSLLSSLYQEIATRQAHDKDLTLQKFLEDIDRLEEHGGKLQFSTRLPKEKSISVMTAHKSKGAEWRTVYIPHVVDGIWGNKRTMLDFRLPFPLGRAHQSGKEEDERRLFYVALTRAKENVILTYSHMRSDGREQVVSRFIQELPPALLTREQGKTTRDGDEIISQVKKKITRHRTVWDREYLLKTFKEEELSATALNNFIECPWKYFFINLIRIPDMPDKAQMFGVAIHEALSFLTRAVRESGKTTFEKFYESFEKCLSHQPLTDKEYKQALKKGKEMLRVFWDKEMPTWHKNSLAEFNIRNVFVPVGGTEGIRICGRLDKMEIHGDREVKVVDYKTGRPKTRNAILGKTESSSGNEKRQLDFYRLLLELYEKGKFEMTQGSIYFTEPDEKKRLKEEVFEMSHEDAERVEQEIVRLYSEVTTFSFWNSHCNDKDCEYCRLRDFLITETI